MAAVLVAAVVLLFAEEEIKIMRADQRKMKMRSNWPERHVKARAERAG